MPMDEDGLTSIKKMIYLCWRSQIIIMIIFILNILDNYIKLRCREKSKTQYVGPTKFFFESRIAIAVFIGGGKLNGQYCYTHGGLKKIEQRLC